MRIPVAIFKDDGSVCGVNVPDIKGCYSWGDTIEDALTNAKAAIYSHVEMLIEMRRRVEIAQSTIEALSQDEDYAGAVWALLNIGLK